MFGDFGKMIKQVQQMKEMMPEIQEKLAASQYTATAGGAVTATVDGKLALVDLKIEEQAAADLATDTEMLADLIKAAVASAQQQAAVASADAMKELTGGIDIPGLEGFTS